MKKTVCFALMVVFIGQSASAQLPVEPLDDLKTTTYWTHPKETLALSKPVVLKSIANGENYFIVKATLDKQGPFYFLLDTGAGISILSASFIKQLNLPLTTTRSLRINGVQNNVDFYRVNSIELAEAQFVDYDFAVLENSLILDTISQKENITLAGILGFGLFKEYLLTLDSQNHLVILEQNQLSLAEPQTSIFISEKRVPMMPVLLEDEQHKVNILGIVDSGFSGFFALPSHVNELPFVVMKETNRLVSTGLGQFQVTSRSIKANIFWGKQKLINPPIIQFNNNKSDFNLPYGLIGIQMLAPFQVTFDQKNNLVKIKKSNTNAHEDLTSSLRKVEQHNECDLVPLVCLDNQPETIRHPL